MHSGHQADLSALSNNIIHEVQSSVTPSCKKQALNLPLTAMEQWSRASKALKIALWQRPRHFPSINSPLSQSPCTTTDFFTSSILCSCGERKKKKITKETFLQIALYSYIFHQHSTETLLCFSQVKVISQYNYCGISLCRPYTNELLA